MKNNYLNLRNLFFNQIIQHNAKIVAHFTLNGAFCEYYLELNFKEN